MFATILGVWALPGARILDVTYGKGVFWREVPDIYRVVTSDISTGVDLRALPYSDGCADLLVLDPPYRGMAPTSYGDPTDHQYAGERTLERGVDGVMNLYLAGLREAHRVLGHGGIVVVKCQDTTSNYQGRQRWVHLELIEAMEDMGFAVVDLAVVVNRRVPPTRYPYQRTLRKAHSYFLVGRKGGARPHGQGPVSRWSSVGQEEQ